MVKKSSISSEDSALFRETMRDVTPLNKKKTTIHETLRKTSYSSHQMVDYDLSDYYHEPVQAEHALKYHRPGVGPQQIHLLKSGKLNYTARLDLHGLKPDEAKYRLSHFIQEQIYHEHRWVLIIHGKGGRFGETPVLKNLTNHWLQQIPDVLAFHSALSKHGGTGAVYVLLRKSKQKDN